MNTQQITIIVLSIIFLVLWGRLYYSFAKPLSPFSSAFIQIGIFLLFFIIAACAILLTKDIPPSQYEQIVEPLYRKIE